MQSTKLKIQKTVHPDNPVKNINAWYKHLHDKHPFHERITKVENRDS